MLLQKMSKWFLNFGEKDVLKNAFQKFKYPIDINETSIGDTVIFNKDCKKGFKYFSGYNNYDQVKPLCIMLPKLSGYVTFFNGTMYMSFMIEEEKLLKAYIKVWNKIRNIMKKDLIVNQCTIIKKLKTKIKSYDGKIYTNFCL